MLSNSDFEASPVAIARRRKLTKARLSRLLQKADIDLPIMVMLSAIAAYHHTRFQPYLAQSLAIFGTSSNQINEDRLLAVLQDAWNYFPHDSLQGRSPAEILAEQLR